MTRATTEDTYWRQQLTPRQYRVLRRKGTELPFTGKYVHTTDDGVYRCAACKNALFSSETKFDSGTGWPSFTDPAVRDNVKLHEDRGMLMRRTEVTCTACGGHLGHVFNDGPRGCDRYCINSAALTLDTAGHDASRPIPRPPSGDYHTHPEETEMPADHTAVQTTPTRLLLVANRTCPCPALPAQVIEHVGAPDAEVLVLAPALNSRLRHWVSDVDDAVRAAEQRMSVTIDELRRHGLSVIGQVGDADPLAAIADALATFPASTIMISTWPAGASNWLEKNLPRRAAERFGLPVNHIVSPYDAPVASSAA